MNRAPRPSLSSTQIRSLLANAALRADPWMASMLAPGVLDYIRQHQLYL